MYIRSAALKLPRIPYPPFRLTDPFPFSPFAATFATGFMTFAACCFSVAKSERMRYTRSWSALFQRDRTVSWMLSNEMCTTPRYSRILKYAAGSVRFKHDPCCFRGWEQRERQLHRRQEPFGLMSSNRLHATITAGSKRWPFRVFTLKSSAYKTCVKHCRKGCSNI